MRNFTKPFEILLSKSKRDKEGMFHCNIEDFCTGFEEAGFFRYTFGGYKEVFTSVPLTEKEKERYQQETDEEMKHFVDELSKEINKKIIGEMYKNGQVK